MVSAVFQATSVEIQKRVDQHINIFGNRQNLGIISQVMKAMAFNNVHPL